MNDGLSSRNKLISGFNVLRVSVADPLTGLSILKKNDPTCDFSKILFPELLEIFL